MSLNLRLAMMAGAAKAKRMRRVMKLERLGRMKAVYATIRVGALGLFRAGKDKRARTVRASVPKHHPHGDYRRLLALSSRRRRQVLRAIAMQATGPKRSTTHLWPPQTGARRPEFSSDKLDGRWSTENASA